MLFKIILCGGGGGEGVGVGVGVGRRVSTWFFPFSIIISSLVVVVDEYSPPLCCFLCSLTDS